MSVVFACDLRLDYIEFWRNFPSTLIRDQRLYSAALELKDGKQKGLFTPP